MYFLNYTAVRCLEHRQRKIVNKSTSSRDHAFGYSSFEGWLIISHASGLAGEQNHDGGPTFQIDD